MSVILSLVRGGGAGVAARSSGQTSAVRHVSAMRGAASRGAGGPGDKEWSGVTARDVEPAGRCAAAVFGAASPVPTSSSRRF